eukprot:364451-Chlamydomonas_euryale.AAC.6
MPSHIKCGGFCSHPPPSVGHFYPRAYMMGATHVLLDAPRIAVPRNEGAPQGCGFRVQGLKPKFFGVHQSTVSNSRCCALTVRLLHDVHG